jgi:hypothetical protein
MPPSQNLKRGGKYPYFFSFFYTLIFDDCSPAAAEVLGLSGRQAEYKIRKDGVNLASAALPYIFFRKEESDEFYFF